MKIQFVCRGNTFRSRLAEALMRRRFPNHLISSSGLEADLCLNGHITWYGQWIATKESLGSFVFPTWRKTDWSELASQDIVICMDDSIADEVRASVPSLADMRVFDISDVNDENGIFHDDNLEVELSLLRQTREIFRQMKESVEGLDIGPGISATM
ncbi:hypothetical protein HZC53_01275 [Candidatus Uhrbacteria bacterium]|nr:hypothetical protein [Candidatus Uhrbacteria bacterium]